MKKREDVVNQLRALMDLSALVNSSLSGHEIRERSVEAAAGLLDCERGSLLLRDAETGELCFEVALGEGGDLLKEVRLACGEGIAGWVAEHGEGVIVEDVHNDSRFYTSADGVSGFVTHDMVCVPVWSKGRVIGVLQAMNRRHGRFEQEDMDLLTALGHQVAVAIENATLYEELKETFFETAAALAETIEKRDPYTGGHTRRVMEYCEAISTEMGLGAEEIEQLKLAAILHDIGKVAISDEILRKPTGLTEDEFEVMKGHAAVSADILGHVRSLAKLIAPVRGHHERPDGSGYPDGLAGDELPVSARIIAVADSFDAMTTDRPYRKGMEVDIAASELRKNAGHQFDADVVDAFLRVLASQEAEADDDIEIA